MATKMSREEILAAATQIHLDEAWEIREELGTIRARANANKSSLADAYALGHMTDEQAAEYHELYPTRERLTAEERVERLEEQLAKARERVDNNPHAGQSVDDAVTEAA